MSAGVFLEGKIIELRTLEEKDLTEAYLQWLNDAEVSQFNSHAVFPNTRDKMRSYFATTQTPQNVVLAIVEKSKGTHIGNVALQGIHWINRSAEFAILVGDKNYWGKGVGTEAALLIIEYGFQRLNLHRIHCGTFAGNSGMIAIAQKLGMRLEGRRKDSFFKNGAFTDVLEFGLLKEEYFDQIK